MLRLSTIKSDERVFTPDVSDSFSPISLKVYVISGLRTSRSKHTA